MFHVWSGLVWTVGICCCAIIKQEQWLSPAFVTSWDSYFFPWFTVRSGGSKSRQIKAGSQLVLPRASPCLHDQSASPFDIQHIQLLASNWLVWLFSKLNIQNNPTDSHTNTQTHKVLITFSMESSHFFFPSRQQADNQPVLKLEKKKVKEESTTYGFTFKLLQLSFPHQRPVFWNLIYIYSSSLCFIAHFNPHLFSLALICEPKMFTIKKLFQNPNFKKRNKIFLIT